MKNLVLASNSPRRKELLSLLGYPFTIEPADIAEHHRFEEAPEDYVRRLAEEKAAAVAGVNNSLVVGADTIVVDGSKLLGKPSDPEDARRMLKQLRCRTHQVYTGIALIDSGTGRFFSDVCCTDVPMRDYSDDEIDAYITTGDPMDKAGAYAIQHKGFHPVDDLQGCYASVMGLPLCHLFVGLKKCHVNILPGLPVHCQESLGYSCPIFQLILDRDQGV